MIKEGIDEVQVTFNSIQGDLQTKTREKDEYKTSS
jgi:hypothetical protein